MTWWRKSSASKRSGVIFVVLGVILTAGLAFLGSLKHPPGAGAQATLALAAVAVQLGSAACFGRDGRASPDHAAGVVHRLLGMARKAEEARLISEAVYEGREVTTLAQARQAFGIVGTQLSAIEDEAVAQLQDWRRFYPGAYEAGTQPPPAIPPATNSTNP